MEFWENSTAGLLLRSVLRSIFKVFFIHGEMLEYIYQFLFFPSIINDVHGV